MCPQAFAVLILVEFLPNQSDSGHAPEKPGKALRLILGALSLSCPNLREIRITLHIACGALLNLQPCMFSVLTLPEIGALFLDPLTPLGLCAFQMVDGIGTLFAHSVILDRLPVLCCECSGLVYAWQIACGIVLIEEGADVLCANGLVVDELGQCIHLPIDIDKHVRPLAGGEDIAVPRERLHEGLALSDARQRSVICSLRCSCVMPVTRCWC